MFAVAGVLHLLRPVTFDAIVPRALPGTPRAWTVGSGVAELGLAIALAVPATRRAAGTAAAAFLLAVWPANVKMALDARSPRARAVSFARLPVQVPLVRAAWRAGR
jgi:uncharacterized membrane protein